MIPDFTTAKRIKYDEPIEIPPGMVILNSCCDCGLVHRITVTSSETDPETKVVWWVRDKELTALCREQTGKAIPRASHP